MKGLIYGVVYILVVAFIFGFFLNKAGAGVGIGSPGGENLYLSKDGGENWSQIEVKEKNLAISGENIVFSAQNPSNLYLASAQGIFQIKEDKKAVKEEGKISSSPIIKFIQNPHDANILYSIVNEAKNQKILISHDKGKTFKTIFVSGKDDKISVFKVDPVSYFTLYIGTKNGLFLVSNDSGESWQKKQDFSNQSVFSIGIRPTDGAIFISISQPLFQMSYFINPPLSPIKPEVLFSRDGGNTFVKIEEAFDTSQIGGNFLIKEIEADSGGRVYFISKNKIFFTNNNQIMPLGLISPSKDSEIRDFTIDPKNPNILYIGAGNILYKTKNQGINWETLETPPQKPIKEIKINPQSPNTILLSTIG